MSTCAFWIVVLNCYSSRLTGFVCGRAGIMDAHAGALKHFRDLVNAQYLSELTSRWNRAGN